MKKIGVNQVRTDDRIQFKVVLPDGRFIRDSAAFQAEYEMAKAVYRKAYGAGVRFETLTLGQAAA